MKKGILTNTKRICVFILAILLITPMRSAEAPSAISAVSNEAPNIISWSGIRMITLGARYMTEVPALSSEWVLRNKSQILKDEFSDEGEEILKIAKSISEGMRNVGKMLVLVGAAKEYTDYFEYANNPNNPLNNKEKYTPEIIQIKQAARLEYLQTVLGFLQQELNKQNINSEWLVKLFDSNTSATVSAKSLKFGLGKIGEVLEHFNVYGIGIQVTSDIPLGAMLATLFSKWLPSSLEKAGSRFSLEDAVGVLYYMKKKESPDVADPRKDPLYRDLPLDHPIFEMLKRETYRFAARTYEQGGAQVDGVSYARGTSSKSKMEVNLTVSVTFLASTEVLRNFEVSNLNNAWVAELSTKNNLSNALPGVAKSLALKAQAKIEEAYGKTNHFEFLSSNVQIAAAHVWGQVNEETGLAVEVPNMMLRLSMGNYAMATMKGRSSNDVFSVKGSLGSLTIDAN
ncbi:MAG: hypothetical protein R3A80_10990 [Bdellovibrionota bacterium]